MEIRTISIDKEENIHSSTIEELSNINLSKDILIITPFLNNDSYLDYELDCFQLRNMSKLERIVNGNYYKFVPPIKLSTPFYIHPYVETAVSGINIIGRNFNKREGIQLNQVLKIDDKVVNFDSDEKYLLYDNISFDFQITNPNLHREDGRFRGMIVSSNTPLMNLFFMYHANDLAIRKVQHIYIINYRLIYNSFPDFSKE